MEREGRKQTPQFPSARTYLVEEGVGTGKGPSPGVWVLEPACLGSDPSSATYQLYNCEQMS